MQIKIRLDEASSKRRKIRMFLRNIYAWSTFSREIKKNIFETSETISTKHPNDWDLSQTFLDRIFQTFVLFGSASCSFDGILPYRNEDRSFFYCRSSFVGVDLVVNTTTANTGLACPGINVRACLAGLHVPYATLVPEIADLRVVALFGSILHTNVAIEWNSSIVTIVTHMKSTFFLINVNMLLLLRQELYRIMASKRFKRVQKRQRRWIPDPLYGLPIGNYPYVVHRDDGVEERNKAFLMMRLSEPRGMIEQAERCSISRKNAIKISCFIQNRVFKINNSPKKKI